MFVWRQRMQKIFDVLSTIIIFQRRWTMLSEDVEWNLQYFGGKNPF